MRILPFFQGILLGFLVFSATFCYGEDKVVEVVGLGECADCKESNIKSSQALSGLGITIECKSSKGEFETRGVGELDGEGKFKVSLPKEIIKDGKLKEECYAQLHSASAAPCPAHNGIEASKIILHSKSNEKHTFGPKETIKFSSSLCTSAFLWTHHKYPPLPTLPPFHQHPWKKSLPPLKHFGHPLFPPLILPPKPCPPIYKKPLPPPVPIYQPPVYNPSPPVPVYKPKPKPPVYSPPPVPIYSPPPVPIYNPPPVPIYSPPPVPIYKPKPKPKPPVYTHPPVPIYHKPLPPHIPIYKPPIKPLPPIPKIPPYKKPCPPIIPLPQLPPKIFHHPKFGHHPPLPPFPQHP